MFNQYAYIFLYSILLLEEKKRNKKDEILIKDLREGKRGRGRRIERRRYNKRKERMIRVREGKKKKKEEIK